MRALLWSAKLHDGLKIAFISLLLLSLAACSLLPSQLASPAQQISPGQQVTEEPPKVLAPLSAARIKPQLLWQHKLHPLQPGYIKLHPTLSGNTLFAADKNNIFALNKNNGKILWKKTLDETITGGLNTGKDSVFVGTENGMAIALDSNTGKTRWISLLEQPIVAISTEKKGKVVFRTLNGKIHALSSTNGDLLWLHTQRTPTLSLQGSSTPLLAGPLVVTGFDNGSVVAYDLDTGKEAWSIKLGSESNLTELSRLVDIDAEMKTVGTALFAASYQGFLAGIDMRSGRVGWKRPISSYSGIDANEQELFITDNQGNLWKLNPLTGEPVWKNDDLIRRSPTAPSLATKSLLIVGDKLGYLHWYNTVKGETIGRVHADSSSYLLAPLVQGRTVYAISRNGLLSAYRF